jgi:hypothetical protein
MERSRTERRSKTERLPASASDYAKLLADETEKWGKVVKFSGAKAE